MNSRAQAVFFFLSLLYVLRLFLIGFLQLAPDEAHYWYWSKNLQLSYFDHPPMVAYVMAFFTWIGGDNQFSVRIGGLLLTILSNVFIYLSTKRFSEDDIDLPWEILVVLNVTLLFSTGCIIQTPDTPMLLFWTMAIYSGSQIITGGAAAWWYLFGVALGLGLLSKYTMILVVPCLFAFLLFSRHHRRWLFRKEPYLAIILGLFIFSPVLLWNREHQWVSFVFQLKQGFSPVQGSAIWKLLEYIGGQLGVITPLLFLAFAYYSFWGFSYGLRHGRSEFLYLVLMCWPVLIFFALSTLRGEVAEANWPAPAYITGLLLTGCVFRQHFRERQGHKKFVYIAVGLSLALNLLISLHLVRPYIPLPPKLDTTSRLHGWRELGENIVSFMEQYPSERGYFLVADRGITLVAEAVFYTGNKFVGLDFFRPEEYTFLRDLNDLKGKNAIILLYYHNDSDVKRYEPYFKEVRVIGKNSCRYRGEKVRRLDLLIALGKEFRGDWQPIGGPAL